MLTAKLVVGEEEFNKGKYHVGGEFETKGILIRGWAGDVWSYFNSRKAVA
jgi:hypothetical protein